MQQSLQSQSNNKNSLQKQKLSRSEQVNFQFSKSYPNKKKHGISIRFKDVQSQKSDQQIEVPIKNLDDQTEQLEQQKYWSQSVHLFSPKSSQMFSPQSKIKKRQNMQISIIDDKVLKNKDSLIWNDYWKNQQKLSTTLLKIIMEGRVDKLKQILSQNPTNLDRFKYIDDWGLLHFVCNSAAKPSQSDRNKSRLNTQNTNSQSIQSVKKTQSLESGSSLNSKQHTNQQSQGVQPSQQILQILIKNECDIEAQTSIKRRPLHMAVLHNSLQKVRILLQYGCIVNSIDQDFNTPLHYALQLGYNSMVKLIVQHCLKRQIKINFEIRNNCRMNLFNCCRDLVTKQYLLQVARKMQVQQQKSQYQHYLQRVPIFFQGFLSTRIDHVQKFLSYPRVVISKQVQQCKQNQKSIQNGQKASNTKTIGNKCSLVSKIANIDSLVNLSLQNLRQSLVIHLIQSLKNYQKIRKLGQGSFGQVFLVRKKRSSNYYALKCLLKKQIIENKLKKYIYMQRRVLIKVKSPFLVHAHSFFQDKDHLYIVMELCYGGDLQMIIREKKRLQESLVKKYAAEVALALACLHQQDILFRDLKPANVLIDGQGHIKITDFGLAKQANVSYSFLGSKAYLPPEMLVESQSKEHSAAIDWYLFGVFIYELLYGRPPFYSPDEMRMFKNIKEGRIDFYQNVKISKQCRDIVSLLLERNPKKRLGAQSDLQQIASHPWFRDIDWQLVKDKKLQLPKPEVSFEELKVKQFMQQPVMMKYESEGEDGSQDRRFVSWNYYQTPKT